MKKKLVTGALLCAFGAVAVTGGTLAYFTDEAETTNTFTTAKVNIALNEQQRDIQDGQPIPGSALNRVKNYSLLLHLHRVMVKTVGGYHCLKTM